MVLMRASDDDLDHPPLPGSPALQETYPNPDEMLLLAGSSLPHNVLARFLCLKPVVITNINQPLPATTPSTDNLDTEPSNRDDMGPEGDTIKIECHPSSGKQNEVVPAEDFVRAASLGSTHPVGPSPWVSAYLFLTPFSFILLPNSFHCPYLLPKSPYASLCNP